MATKSILKNVYIKDRRTARRLVSALENASGKSSQIVALSRSTKDLDKDEIQKIFGGNNGRL